MYTRVVKGRNKDGSTRYYLQLVHGHRQNGKVRQKLICSIGRLDILQTSGGLDRLIASLARHSERCWVEAEAGGLLSWAKSYGPVLVFRRLWEDLVLFDTTLVHFEGQGPEGLATLGLPWQLSRLCQGAGGTQNQRLKGLRSENRY